MPVPTVITDLTTVAATNSPPGTESAKGTVDDYFRAHAAFIRQIYNQTIGPTTTLASAATVSIGFAATSNISITGTTTITAFDTYAEGTLRTLIFQSALTLTHNSSSLILPGATNIVTVGGDTAVFKSLGSGNWKCMFYQRGSEAPTPKLPLTGGTLTGPLVLNNSVGLFSKDSGGTTRQLTSLAIDNNVYNFVAGGQNIRWYNQAGTVEIAQLSNAGAFFAVSVSQTSDERKKRNWKPLTDAQLDALARMERSGTFEWIDDGEASVGGSAQEIQAIVPEAIVTSAKGDLSVNYGGLNFAILQAMLRRQKAEK